MNAHTYKVIEVVGSSTKSMDDAVRNAVHEASQDLRKLRWFEVTETRGHIHEGTIAHWQVTVKIGFSLESSSQ